MGVATITIKTPIARGSEAWAVSGRFQHAYVAKYSARNSGNTQALEGQEVSKLIDLIGSTEMPYAGISNPSLGVKPIYKKGLNGGVFLQNQTGVYFESAALALSGTLEIWEVIGLSNYQINEATHRTNQPYIGDVQQAGTRLRSAGEGGGDNSFFSDLKYSLNKLTLIRRRISDVRPVINGNTIAYLSNAELWINGVKEPKTMTTFKITPNVPLGIGVETNNSHCTFQAIFYKFGSMSDADAVVVEAELMETYKINKDLSLPLSANVDIIYSGDNVSVVSSFIPVGGVPENTGAIETDWFLTIGEGVTGMIRLPELHNLSSFNKSAYPSRNFTGEGLRVEVTRKDTQGNYYPIPQSRFESVA